MSTSIDNIPSRGGKISLSRLQDLPVARIASPDEIALDTPIVIRIDDKGFRFDYLWHPSTTHPERLFILFSGDARRKKNPPPVFQRWSWASFFPGNCLFVSDPMLFCHESLGLCWYAGNHTYDPLNAIASFVAALQHRLAVPSDQVYAYGSSGGGFASIRFLHFYPSAKSVAINPQTDITVFEYDSVERYLNRCFEGLSRAAALESFPSRLSLLTNAQQLQHRQILLAQNLLDPHHYEKHYKPLCAAMGASVDQHLDGQGLKTLLFRQKGGHKKAEGAGVFTQIVKMIESGEL